MKATTEMVNRFLSWKLPDDFAPDGGVVFTPPSDWPTGTNLFTAAQAKAMLEHVLDTEGLDDPLRLAQDEANELRCELEDFAYRPVLDANESEDGEPRITGWECLICGALEPKRVGFDHLDECVLNQSPSRDRAVSFPKPPDDAKFFCHTLGAQCPTPAGCLGKGCGAALPPLDKALFRAASCEHGFSGGSCRKCREQHEQSSSGGSDG